MANMHEFGVVAFGVTALLMVIVLLLVLVCAPYVIYLATLVCGCVASEHRKLASTEVRLGDKDTERAQMAAEFTAIYTDRKYLEFSANSLRIVARSIRLRRQAVIAVLFDGVPVAAFVGSFLGCLTTLGFIAFGIHPCVASALATTLLCGQLLAARKAGLFPAAFFPAIYGGTFAGMTPVVWPDGGASGHAAIHMGLLFVSLSTVCGLAFSIVARLDSRSAVPFGSGYGGRLGAIAAAASLLFVSLTGPSGADAGHFHDTLAGVGGTELWAARVLACLGGAMGTMFALRQPRTVAAGGAIKTSVASVVALVGLLTLYLGTPADRHTLDAFYAGCFLGMSTPGRLIGRFQPVFAAVVLTSMLVLVRAVLPPIGGGLGLAACMSVALLTAWTRATAWLRQTARTILANVRSLR